MCFSAAASFSSSAVLAATGIASIIKAKNTPQKMLSAIPLIFSIQQCVEGVLWLALRHQEWQQWQGLTTYLFLVFAQAVWPVVVPLCMLAFEHEQRKRILISLLLLCGVAIAAYIGFSLFHYPVQAFAENDHIRYAQGSPFTQRWYYGLFYFLPTIVSSIISSEKILRWLGYLFLLSYAATRLLFHYYEISVWCFFGAVISIIVFFMIGKMQRVKQYQS